MRDFSSDPDRQANIAFALIVLGIIFVGGLTIDALVSSDPQRWLRSLPATLTAQRTVIEKLLEHVRVDDRLRLFVVGCSIGRGAADSLSDVDALIGVRDRAFDEVTRVSAEIAHAGGRVLDLFQQIMPAASPEGSRYQHTYAHYADGVELDLVLAIARETLPPRPDWIVLYDPDDTVRGEPTRKVASPEDVRAWGFNCLVRLHACAKYLTRGSLWEAQLMLERARADYWCVWATSKEVAEPLYGLTAVLDDSRKPMPEGIGRTVAQLDRTALARAALALVDSLLDAWPRADAMVGASGLGASTPLAGHVRDKLSSLLR